MYKITCISIRHTDKMYTCSAPVTFSEFNGHVNITNNHGLWNVSVEIILFTKIQYFLKNFKINQTKHVHLLEYIIILFCIVAFSLPWYISF